MSGGGLALLINGRQRSVHQQQRPTQTTQSREWWLPNRTPNRTDPPCASYAHAFMTQLIIIPTPLQQPASKFPRDSTFPLTFFATGDAFPDD